MALEMRLNGGKGCFSWLLDLTRNPLFSVYCTDTDGLLMMCSLVCARRGLGLSVPFPSGYDTQEGLRVPLQEAEDASST